MLLKCKFQYIDEVSQGRQEVRVLILNTQCNRMLQYNIKIKRVLLCVS
jgi:hypothetical protein